LERLPNDILDDVAIVLIDGHQMDISIAIAKLAKASNIPVAIDGGSWKSGFEKVLPNVKYAICSENFYPPACKDRQDVFDYLQELGIPHIAITQGENPIQYCDRTQRGEIEVPIIKAFDTLGAGDIFHGAFCHYILQTNFRESLSLAARIASNSCQFFGTRKWMKDNL
jgi:sugar/nucleoside kinase (ribokinase family)